MDEGHIGRKQDPIMCKFWDLRYSGRTAQPHIIEISLSCLFSVRMPEAFQCKVLAQRDVAISKTFSMSSCVANVLAGQ